MLFRSGLGALQRTGVIGLLLPELSNPVFPAFAEALETRAAAAGYSSLLCNTRSAGMREEEYVRMVLARGVEGMIFVSPAITNAPPGEAPDAGYYTRLVADGVRMVFINGATPALDVVDIAVDEQLGQRGRPALRLERPVRDQLGRRRMAVLLQRRGPAGIHQLGQGSEALPLVAHRTTVTDR